VVSYEAKWLTYLGLINASAKTDATNLVSV
jgi:hypothetical protein